MADLNQACSNMGLDSSKLRPIAHATDTGRVAVYIGAAWQELPLGKALNLRDQIDQAVKQLLPGAARAVAVTATMVREMEAHIPVAVRALGNMERWQWMAEYLSGAIAEPNRPCTCCGCTPNGDILTDVAEVPHA